MSSFSIHNNPFDVLPDRFLDKIQFEPNTGCWLWDAYRNHGDYGIFKFNRRMFRAHRFSYEMIKGEIPKDLEIDHLCRVRCCVNPDHLEIVTHQENCSRGRTISSNLGRNNRIKTHCPRGHAYSQENTYIGKSGSRFCRECKRVSGRKHYWKQKLGGGRYNGDEK